MHPKAFIQTIYLGDRGCKQIIMDGWNSEVRIQVTTVSRVRTTTWNYYSDEDIINGHIVFSNVESIRMEPSGYIPNDSITELKVEELGNGMFLFTFSAYSAKGQDSIEVITSIVASGIHLEDPMKPGVKTLE
ncbi:MULTISPECIES: DUF6258 family protein [Paenibacillus]|uniref:DUF6258 family protein n=1 Tax=Paenibacillus TaxID=44249 RepID=UPI00119FD998|nr:MULTISPECIES: DUF6258 family protein [Paenibacillus]MCM3175868.1 DUF6258 family protein [Paenibacillus sp. MER 99-2]